MNSAIQTKKNSSSDSGWVPGHGVGHTMSAWTIGDYLGAIGVRLNIRRMCYAITPGLYAFGSPGPDSPIFVSANYKLSFDYLRRFLAGMNAWILVLDTGSMSGARPAKAHSERMSWSARFASVACMNSSRTAA